VDLESSAMHKIFGSLETSEDQIFINLGLGWKAYFLFALKFLPNFVLDL
jgi:hypothetical protein